MNKLLLFTLLILSSFQTFAQKDNKLPEIITGKVTDTNGKPLQNVSVVIKGKEIGTITNAKGEYRLSSEGITTRNKIELSHIGYKKQTFKIQDNTTTQLKSGNELGPVIIKLYGDANSDEEYSSQKH